MFRFLTIVLLFLAGLSLPFEWANVRFAGIAWTPAKVMTGLLLALTIARAALEPRAAFRDPKAKWVALFGLAIAVSTAHAYFVGVPPASLLTAAITWYSLIAFYFMLVFLIRDRAMLDTLLIALVLGCVAVTATGFLGLGFTTWSQQGARIGGQGGNSNLLAFNLVIALPAALVLFDASRRALGKLATGGAGLLFLAGIGATLSRSAMLAVLAMGAFWGVRTRSRNFMRLGLPILLLAIAAALFMPRNVAERFASLSPANARTDDSIVSRAHTNRVALLAFAESPLIGIGSLRFFSYAIERGTPFTNVIHHAYLDIAAEEGLLGLVPFVALSVLAWRDLSRVALAARRARRAGSRRGDLELRAMLLQVALLGCFVIAQFQPIQRDKGLWLMFALSTTTRRLATQELGAHGRARDDAPLVLVGQQSSRA